MYLNIPIQKLNARYVKRYIHVEVYGAIGVVSVKIITIFLIAIQSLPETQGGIPNKTRLYQPEAGLRQYAIEHGMDPEKFSVITEAEKNRWAMGCFREDLERDIRFYRGGIERQEDTRKYRKFLTDRDRLIGGELLRRSILKSGLSTTWLDDLMKEWEEIHTQFVQIFSQT